MQFLHKTDCVCHICGRAFISFRWKSTVGSRYRRTVISPEVALSRNLCQVCMLDLLAVIPGDIRGMACLVSSDEQRSKYDESHLGDTDYSSLCFSISNKQQPRLCSFYLRGQCSKGRCCPYRHGVSKGFAAKFNFYHGGYIWKRKHRGAGVRSYLSKVTLLLSEQAGGRKLSLGNISRDISGSDIWRRLCAYGNIELIRIFYDRSCADVTYSFRHSARVAAHTLGPVFYFAGHAICLR
jgi:pre-mRNA-splicing factor RBM22/SLT11